MRSRHAGFTLIELMAVVAIVGLLVSLSTRGLLQARDGAHAAVCRGQLAQVQAAHLMYLDEHRGRFFPFAESTPEGRLWYWGRETGGTGEGNRGLDKEAARLAPYFDQDSIELCPSFARNNHHFKAKFSGASYGYGINVFLLSDWPRLMPGGASRYGTPLTRLNGVTSPVTTMGWADAAQVNTWQAPASPRNPLIEEWYYLNNINPPKFHFRHVGTTAQVAWMDGHVSAIEPVQLSAKADGRTGFHAPPGNHRNLELSP